MKLFADQFEAPGQFAIAGERPLDALGIAAVQRAGGMPRQEDLDLLALGRFLFQHSRRVQQLCQLLARIEHARLHGILRDADDLCDFFHRLLVVVDEIDDLPMFGRKADETVPDDRTLVLLREGRFRIVRRILDCQCRLVVQFLVRFAPQRRQSLEPRDCQQPGRNRGPRFEPTSLTPHVKKNFADQVLGLRFIAHETQREPVNPHVVAREQHLHCEPVAGRNPSDKLLVRCRLYRPTINSLG